MRRSKLWKGLVVAIIVLFVGTSITPIIAAKYVNIIEINENVVKNEDIKQIQNLHTNNNYLYDDQLDQYQTQYNEHMSVCTNTHYSIVLIQSFKPTLNTLTRVELYAKKVGNPTDDLVVSIREYNGNSDLTSVSVNADKRFMLGL